MATDFIPCSVDNCNKNSHYSAKGCKGYCRAHYKRFNRYGNPLSGRTSRGEPMQFIHEIAILYQGADCLLWPFCKSTNGYGHVSVDGRMALASRYVCEIVHGAPPSPTHEAAHNCGKGHLGCVNPHHLEWKTSKDNQADKLLHGTSNRGIRQGSCKITDVQAREILTLKGARTLKYLADKFNISPSTVRSIQERKTWAWLD